LDLDCRGRWLRCGASARALPSSVDAGPSWHDGQRGRAERQRTERIAPQVS
jgi:hypothetical protein